MSKRRAPTKPTRLAGNVELRQVIGEYFDRSANKVRRVAWDMDILLLDGKQIATINRVAGAPIALLSGVMLTPSQKQAVEEAIAAARGGKKPASIDSPVQTGGGVLLDDEETEDTEDDDE